jgi:hypothetical protein
VLNLEAEEESMTKKNSGVAGVPGVQEEEIMTGNRRWRQIGCRVGFFIVWKGINRQPMVLLCNS